MYKKEASGNPMFAQGRAAAEPGADGRPEEGALLLRPPQEEAPAAGGHGGGHGGGTGGAGECGGG